MKKTLLFEIVATKKQISKNIDIKINNVARLEEVIFKHEVSKQDCQLSYFSYPVANFSNSIYLNKSIDYLNENIVNQNNEWIKIETNTYLSKSNSLLITNKFVQSGNREIPLFYGMRLDQSVIDASLADGTRKDVIGTFDKKSKVFICNDTNYWDPIKRDFRGISVVIKYADRQETRLFRNEPLFKEADYTDIDPETLSFYDYAPVYSVEKIADWYKYTFHGEGPFFLKEKERQKINVIDPDLSNKDNWHIRFTEGSFVYKVDGENYFYEIQSQNKKYFPYAPYRTISEIAEVIDKNTLYLKQPVIIKPESNLHFSVVIRDNTNNIRKCYTTSNVKIGKPYKGWNHNQFDATWEKLKYNYDYKNSIVILDNTIPLLRSDTISVQYCSNYDNFIYNEVDLNPRFKQENQAKKRNKYLFFLVPNRYKYMNKSLFHIEYSVDIKGNENIENISYEPDISYVGNKLENYIEDRFINNDNVFNFIELCYAEQYIYFDENKAILEDVRLKDGIDRSKHMEFLEKYPWAYFNKMYSKSRLEYPNKLFLDIEINNNDVLEQDKNKQRDAINKHITQGNMFHFKSHGIKPRVIDIYSLGNNELIVKHMPERPGVVFNLYKTKNLGSKADPNIDTLVNSYSVPYSNNIYTHVVDIEGISEYNINDFYLSCNYNDITTISNVYRIKTTYE